MEDISNWLSVPPSITRAWQKVTFKMKFFPNKSSTISVKTNSSLKFYEMHAILKKMSKTNISTSNFSSNAHINQFLGSFKKTLLLMKCDQGFNELNIWGVTFDMLNILILCGAHDLSMYCIVFSLISIYKSSSEWKEDFPENLNHNQL